MVEASPETEAHFTEYAIEEFLVRDEPYYRPIGDEIELFTAAYRPVSYTHLRAHET